MKINACCDRCEKRLYAQEIPIFTSLSTNELEQIIDLREHGHFKKGDVLFSEGDEISKLFIVSNGLVKLTKNTFDGKEQIIDILGVGDFFGENNIIGDSHAMNVSAIAIQDLEVCTISRGDLEKIITKNPQIALKLLDGLNKKLKDVQNLSTNLASNVPESRIANILLKFASDYSYDNNSEILINLPLNREDIANYCGIARETLSRKLSYLEKLDIIEVHSKKIKIKDMEYLKELV